jgi:hypothetical protein
MAAAVKGELTTNGKAIWAKTLGGKLRAAGCFMTEAPGKKAQIDESFL